MCYPLAAEHDMVGMLQLLTVFADEVTSRHRGILIAWHKQAASVHGISQVHLLVMGMADVPRYMLVT